MKSGLVWFVILVVICASASVALGSQTQWSVRLRLYSGAIGGSPQDTNCYFGVRSGAYDIYDSYDAAKTCPSIPPMPPTYVCLCWYRTTWGTATCYSSDYRSPIAANTSKTWCDLQAGCSGPPTQTMFMDWVIGASSAWVPPANYTFRIYDEGDFLSGEMTSCLGGAAYDMRTETFITWTQPLSGFRAFHIVVTNLTPPTCSFTITPNPAECPGVVDLDASGSSGTPPLSFAWDLDQDGLFDDAAGVMVTGINLGPPGTYNLGLLVTDGLGQTATCYQLAQVVDTLPPDVFT